MKKEDLYKNLEEVNQIALASRFQRFFNNPFKYIHAILFRMLIYPNFKKEKEVISDTFFGEKMNILLPSSTDIYLTKGKSHQSEIRLAKFLIKTLQPGDTFLDIGAHYGYFSLLASKLIGDTGKVMTIEASPVTFKVLHKNVSSANNIEWLNLAISDTKTEMIFYEFPNLYSEYNTLNVSQFENEKWFNKYPPKKVKLQSEKLDELLLEKDFQPSVIKIDVEGAEFQVLNGGKNFLLQKSPVIIIEYLSAERGNEAHMLAEELLKNLNYLPHIITDSGTLQSLENIPKYLKENNLESDNIVFIKD